MPTPEIRERFDVGEWNDLRVFPAAVFALVAGVDAEVDPQEWAEYDEELDQGAIARDPLQAAILADLGRLPETERRGVIGRADAMFGRKGAVEEWASRVRAALEAHLDDVEYHRFTTSMVLFGAEVADSSGTDDLTEVDFEATALSLLVELFSVDMDAGLRALAKS